MSARVTGYARITDPGGTREHDTFTCAHCQRIVHVRPRADPASCGGLCKLCMGLVCPRCNARTRCDPWEKKMERAEARDRFLRSAGLG